MTSPCCSGCLDLRARLVDAEERAAALLRQQAWLASALEKRRAECQRLAAAAAHASQKASEANCELQELRHVSAQALKLAETCIQLKHQHFTAQSTAQPAQGLDTSQLHSAVPISPGPQSIPGKAATSLQPHCPAAAPPTGPSPLITRSFLDANNPAHAASPPASETLKDTIFPIPAPSLHGQSPQSPPHPHAHTHAHHVPLPTSSSSYTSSSAPSTEAGFSSAPHHAANPATQKPFVEDQDELLQEAISLLDNASATPDLLPPQSLSPAQQQPTVHYQPMERGGLTSTKGGAAWAVGPGAGANPHSGKPSLARRLSYSGTQPQPSAAARAQQCIAAPGAAEGTSIHLQQDLCLSKKSYDSARVSQIQESAEQHVEEIAKAAQQLLSLYS